MLLLQVYTFPAYSKHKIRIKVFGCDASLKRALTRSHRRLSEMTLARIWASETWKEQEVELKTIIQVAFVSYSSCELELILEVAQLVPTSFFPGAIEKKPKKVILLSELSNDLPSIRNE